LEWTSATARSPLMGVVGSRRWSVRSLRNQFSGQTKSTMWTWDWVVCHGYTNTESSFSFNTISFKY